MYKDLKVIYNETRLDVFCMAVCYLLDIGYSNAREITDEDIEAMEGNGLMTKGFCQMLAQIARDIAKQTEIPEIIQFCSAEDVFDTQFYANKLSRDRLETLLHNAIAGLRYGDYEGESLADYLGADEEEMEMLGYEEEV